MLAFIALSLPLSLSLSSAPCQPSSHGCVLEAEVASARIKMIVDSGADLTVLTKEGAERAGVRYDRSSPIIPVNGVGGGTWAYLVRVPIKVDDKTEDRVLVAVAPTLSLGDAEGLLGMTFLERFKTSIGGGKLELTPIDEGQEPRPGGHGRNWWMLRFQRNAGRVEALDRALSVAKKVDSALQSEIGSDPSGITVAELVKKLRDFSREEEDELANQAARNSVPLEWRR